MRVLAIILQLFLFPLCILAQNNVGIGTTDPQHPFQVNVDSVYNDTIIDQSIPGSIGISIGLAVQPGAEKAAQGVMVDQTGMLSGVQLFFAIPTVANEVLVEVFRGAGPEGTLMTSATILNVTIGTVIVTFPQPWPQVTEGEWINIVLTPVSGSSLKWKSAGYDVDSTWHSYHFNGTWNTYEHDLALNTFVAFTDTVEHEVLAVRGDRKVMINDYSLPRYDGAAGHILQTDGNGSVSWIPASALTLPDRLSDADLDTRVEVEASPDEDIIRLSTDGDERMTIMQNGKIGINASIPVSDLDIRGDDDLLDGGELQLATPTMSNFIRMFGGRLGDRNPFLAFSDQDTFHFVTTTPTWQNYTRRVSLRPDGNLGIGISNPANRLTVLGSSASVAPVLRAAVSYAGNTHVHGIEGYSKPGVGYGKGGYFIGGGRGIQAYAEGGTSTDLVIGVEGTANGSAGTRVGLYGRALGGTTNWAGYFNDGNVYIHNRAAIGTLVPEARMHIQENSSTSFAHLRLSETSSNDFGRIKFENINEPGIFWDMAVRADSLPGESRFNVFYNNPGSTGDKLTVLGSGNVGIGTTSPAEKLHVVGDMRVSGLAGSGDRNVIVDSNGKLKPSTIGSGGGGWIETPNYVYNNTHNIGIGTSTPASRLHIIHGGSGSAQSISFPGTPPFYIDGKSMTLDAGNINATGNLNSNLALQGTSDGSVTLVQGGGTVGIGHTAVTNKMLTIQGPEVEVGYEYGTMSLISEIVPGDFTEMLFDGHTIQTINDDLRINFGSPYDIILASNQTYSNKVGIGTSGPTSRLTIRGSEGNGMDGLLRLNKEMSTSTFMVMDNNEIDVHGEPFFINGTSTQNVAIGTTDPAVGYKLSVGGKIIAEEVRVQLQTAWPDYVFSPQYELMPLQDVQKVIAQQGHLPGIPSAHEVESEGILLGDMQRMMMEKIEELTLHLIEMDQRMRSIEAENKALRERIKSKP